MTGKVVIFAEDPGAANWLGPLSQHLHERGNQVAFLADGVALLYLRQRGFHVQSIAPEEDITACLHADRIHAVVVGTAENFETRAFEIVDAAKRMHIPSFSVVDQSTNVEHRFRGTTSNRFAHVTDIVFVACSAVADEFVRLGLPREHLRIVGNPHHDAVRERGKELARLDRKQLRKRLFPGLAADRLLVVFLTEVGYVMNPEAKQWEQEFRLLGRGGSTYRTLVVLEELVGALAELMPKPLLVVRLHPKSERSEFSALESEIADFSAGGDPLIVCASADLVVGMTSSLLEESALMGCRTLSIVPRPVEAKWLSAVADGLIPCVSERSDLRQVIPGLLFGPPPKPALHLDGPLAVEAIARHIEQVVASHAAP
ncbi:hypothetical protein [Hyphomicrobium sp.]|uniref:hypothetical protein n=1 Tax=Hyphomicrobium sp. TaxID=82 RepID=UPI0025BA3498|nr:hypothetical protein [Hyphomicrobium sp.]MCC7250947.1 hypothetical protein [Hyphomicrobium sp.]